MNTDQCDADNTCESGYLRTVFDNSAAEARMDPVVAASGEVSDQVHAWETKGGVPEHPVDQDWLVSTQAICRRASDDN